MLSLNVRQYGGMVLVCCSDVPVLKVHCTPFKGSPA